MSSAVAPPRSRTTAELVVSMTRFGKTTQTEARHILRELEMDGWIVSEGDEWRATQQARDHFAGIMWEVGEEAPGGRPAYGYGRRVA